MNKIENLFYWMDIERFLRLEEVARSVGRYSVDPKRVSRIEKENSRTDDELKKRFKNV